MHTTATADRRPDRRPCPRPQPDHAAAADRLEARSRSRPRRRAASTTRRWARRRQDVDATAAPLPASLPVLFADDYGFHTGNTWYRGRFHATGEETRHPPGLATRRRRAGVLGLAERHLPRQLDHRQRATSPSRPAPLTHQRRQRRLGAHREHGARGGLQRVQRQQGRPRPDRRLAARRAAGARSRGGCRASRRRGPARHRARAAVDRRPVRRARRLAPARLSRTTRGRRSRCRTPTPRPGVSWYRTDVALDLPQEPGHLARADDHRRPDAASTGRCCSSTAGRSATTSTTAARSTRFPVPNGILNPNGSNTHRHRGLEPRRLHRRPRQGRADQLRQLRVARCVVRAERQPALRRARRTRCRRRPGTDVTLSVPDGVQPGQTFTATATVAVPASGATVSGLSARARRTGRLDGRRRRAHVGGAGAGRRLRRRSAGR